VKEGQRLSFSFLLASALSVSAQLPGQAHSNIIQGQPATVYRDPYGVPHIEAADERVAWFALGCEEARDGLLYIQFSAKRIQGKADARVALMGTPWHHATRTRMTSAFASIPAGPTL
jgi:acyl-homoserine lactone acylase PvdQ